MVDYAGQLIMESKNNVHHSADYTRKMACPNREVLGKPEDWRDPERYERKKNRKYPECPSGEEGEVDMLVTETGIWTTIVCPICGYSEHWAAGDGDERF